MAGALLSVVRASLDEELSFHSAKGLSKSDGVCENESITLSSRKAKYVG